MTTPVQNSYEAKLRRQQLILEREKNSFTRYFTSVGYSLLASFTAYPFIRNKVMMQCRPELIIASREPPYTTATSIFKHIWKHEGKTKFFRGFVPFFTFAIPFAFIRQSSTNSFSKDLDANPSPMASFSRGFAATTVSSLLASIFTPFTIGATKMMADFKPAKRAIYEFHGPLKAIKPVHTFGGITNLYVGAVPFYLHNISYFTVLFLANSICLLAGLEQTLGTLLSSAVAVMAAHPFDTVRSRMQYRLQTQVTDYVPEYRGMFDCFRYIWKSEGLRGFYRGGSGAMALYVITTAWLVVAAARGQKRTGKEAKAELMVQKRIESAQSYKQKYTRERLLEEKFYGFDTDGTNDYKD